MDSRVLFTVLDWGLGHATRSVPVIKELCERGAEVSIAGAGRSLSYLSELFPELDTMAMPEQTVKYRRSGALWTVVKRAFQQPFINAEQHAFVQAAVQEHGITHIVSDNVYGAYSTDIPSVIITHQLAPKVPAMSNMVHKRLADWLHAFDAVWIPDEEGDESLAGDLLQNDRHRGPVRYLGPLSRFGRGREAGKNIALTVLLSGPEPQRDILEKKAIKLCAELPGQKVVIRGRPECTRAIPDPDITTVPFADGMALRNYLRRSETVLARSGFSSLSDLIALGVRACVTPTPGQSEQVYLAQRVEKRKWFAQCPQDALTADCIVRAKHFEPPPAGRSRLGEVIDDFLTT